MLNSDLDLFVEFVVDHWVIHQSFSMEIYFHARHVLVALAQHLKFRTYQFYKDISLWWIISYANPHQDSASLYPALGTQIRVPSPFRLSSILMQYEQLNS